MTYLGAPMVYYGDEAGMWGGDDPDDRKPMVWDDLTYENEKSHPLPGKSRSDDPVKFDKDLFKYYRNLIRIRKEQEALRRGSFTTLLTDDKKRVYVFERRTTKDVAVVALNNDMSAQSVTLSLDGQFREQLTGKEVRSIDKRVTLTMEPKTGMILTPIMER